MKSKIKKLCKSCKKKEYCPLSQEDNLQECSYYTPDLALQLHKYNEIN